MHIYKHYGLFVCSRIPSIIVRVVFNHVSLCAANVLHLSFANFFKLMKAYLFEID